MSDDEQYGSIVAQVSGPPVLGAPRPRPIVLGPNQQFDVDFVRLPPQHRAAVPTPSTLCLRGVPSEKTAAGFFLLFTGFPAHAKKLGVEEGGILMPGISIQFFADPPSPNQKCWIAPLTTAQANEIVAFVSQPTSRTTYGR